MDDLHVPIFAQAKIEYTKQLVDILSPHMFDGVKSVYDEAKRIYASKTSTPILMIFRELLEKVPIWNSEIVDDEATRIIHNSECDWLDDLITAVFISHTKILTSIGPNQSFQKINVTIPKTSTFIHKSYINLAREIWKNPYLFNESVPGHEYQRNSKEVEIIVKASIEKTIRNLLPVKEILREHLETKESEAITTKEELKKLLQSELQTLKDAVANQKVHTKEDEADVADKSDEADEADVADDDSHESVEDSQMGPEIVYEKDQDDLEEDKNESEDINESSNKSNLETSEIEPTSDSTQEPDKITHLISELKQTIDEETTRLNQSQEPSQESPSFPTLSDEPSESQVQKQTANIVVNDITLPVDVDTGDSIVQNAESTPSLSFSKEDVKEPVLDAIAKEPHYDNADIISQPNTNTQSPQKIEKMKTLLTLASEVKGKPDISVVKKEEVAKPAISPSPSSITPEPSPQFSLSNLYPSMVASDNKTPPSDPAPETVATEKVEVAEKVPADVVAADVVAAEKVAAEKVPAADVVAEPTPEPKSPRKEVTQVTDEDINDTDSLAGFLNDVKQIAKDKGVNVDTSQSGMFTLFEDASEN